MPDDDIHAGYTPAAFHEQPGVADWRVTSWGPQAEFAAWNDTWAGEAP